VTPTERTADQTETGIYWAYDGTPSLCAPPRLYNQITMQIAQQMNSNDIETARLLALVNVAMSDAGVASWESKYFHQVWRPVCGIREADEGTGTTGLGDGNAATVCDPTFSPLGAPASNLNGPNFTPPFPAYTSGHSTFSAAGAAVLADFFDTDAQEREALAVQYGLNPGTLNVLHRKIERMSRLPFLKRKAVDDSVKRLLETLQRGRHVVLEFGRHNSLDAYILVANVLTRRIHERYVEMTDRGEKPTPLVITIEEAHKFLNADAARQTTFGTIARELRKFYVTLLVVDQRPSGIDAEVLSQIGTRMTCQLNDERDIDAIFTGVSGGAHLRTVLATLDSREQALLLGHAVPMPMMIRTRKYDTAFYATIGADGPAMIAARSRRYEEIFGSDE
jgi:hypothetical protein